MKKIVTIILALLFISLSIGGYFYYKEKIAPKAFIESFLEELEFKGVKDVDNKYFIAEYHLKPLKTWDEYQIENSEKNIPIDEKFEIWKKVYFPNIEEYIFISPKFPDPIAMTNKEFIESFKGLEFENIELKFVENDESHLKAVGYTEVKAKNYYTNLLVGGRQRFEIVAQNGKEGWKILAFALDI